MSAVSSTTSASTEREDSLGTAAVIVSAALAMAATLPGRTHGLGLITTRLLSDFAPLSETTFAHINLVATLLGSLFCLPCGWMMDRYGARPVLGLTLIALGGVVLGMTTATTVFTLAVMITLTRGLGQSMLSVVSISMLGKWFRREAGAAMGLYAVLMTVFLAVATVVAGTRVSAVGWRQAWSELGWGLWLLMPLACCLAFPSKERVFAGEQQHAAPAEPLSATLSQALRTSCFWLFALGISLFGLISSGVTLFQQQILAERGLPEAVFQAGLAIGLLFGLIANLAGGWAIRYIHPTYLLQLGLLLLSGSLLALPLLQTATHAYCQSAVGGLAGGLITVLFFAIWNQAFGRAELGRIQAAAQMLTVLASALGPEIVAYGHHTFGSYLPILVSLAGCSLLLAVAGAFVRVPSALRGDWAASPSETNSLPSLQPEST